MMRASTNGPKLRTMQPGYGGLAGSRPYPGMPRSRARLIWLTTFTDLTALMLTFFVLQFSMSKIDEVQWQNLSDSFQQRLSSVQETQVPLPQQVLGIEPRQTIPGDDLVYLTAVIGEQLKSAGVANHFAIDQRDARIVIRPLVPTVDGLDERGREALEVLAALIARLDNRVDLEFRQAPGDTAATFRSRYRAALEGALAVQERLAALGARNLSTVKARLADPSNTAAPGDARVSFVIHAHEEAGQ
jgi:chemotaxis protein MotB